MADNININQTINEITVVESSNNVVITAPGPQGIQGVPGRDGINGGNFTFEQQSNSASWNVVHNLGYYPNVSIKEYGNKTVEGEVVYINANSLTILFSVAISGYAYLS